MDFTDYPYYLALTFLILITLFLRPNRRWSLLLFASVLFYGFGRWEYLALLLLSISIDYGCALGIGQIRTRWKKRLFLCLSIFSNLSILVFFKYLTELYADWAWLEARNATLGIQLDQILLPLGISFYTLQSMGYTIDVYRNEVKPEKHFGYFALYVCFFPQLVAGPIERAKKLIPQLKSPAVISLNDVQSGLFLIGFGLLKKLVVADRLFLLINDQLGNAANLDGWQAMSFGTVAFFAVYMDISAYTDIARGSARLLGIELSRNFNRPMLALSTGDFWKRWHMSLSSWMMNYLYRPFAQVSRSKRYRDFVLIMTFTVIGVWHGPTLPFILMGALQGLVIVTERVLANRGLRWPNASWWNVLRLLRTHLVINISGMLFMSPDLGTFNALVSSLLNYDVFFDATRFFVQLQGGYSASILFIGLVLVLLIGRVQDAPNHYFSRWVVGNEVGRVVGLYLLIAFAILFAERTSSGFLYFFF